MIKRFLFKFFFLIVVGFAGGGGVGNGGLRHDVIDTFEGF